ncbi:MAG TPA: flavin-dependent oxidoreductase [Blastocatellia bacterium]|nr:flavin-dependent oxidoreductase [Blastocatellia bacterium]
MKALIVGGGIGGLVTALCLERAGIEAQVFESVPEIRPLGVGINLLPHSVRILTALGLDEKLAATGIATAELIYFNKFGQLIWREPRGLAAGYHWPQYSIHRGRLQMLLLDAVRERLGAAAVRTGCHLESFVEIGDQVEATFIHRATGAIAAVESGDVLIGADGIHSRVRQHFYPHEQAPQFSGKVLWRGVTEGAPYLTGRSMFMAGYANRKFVAYPICPQTAVRGQSLINWVADVYVGDAYAGTPRDWNRQVDTSAVLPAFADWHFDWLDIPALIAGAAAIYEFPMIDRDPVERWSFGRVTLLGDAAHPMYPIGSNGASQAILDAPALASALQSEPDVVTALRRYEQERLQPTARIVLSNRQQGPEQVMQLVEDRAPNGFTNLHAVISQMELEEIAGRYKQIAGFSRESLNAQSLT